MIWDASNETQRERRFRPWSGDRWGEAILRAMTAHLVMLGDAAIVDSGLLAVLGSALSRVNRRDLPGPDEEDAVRLIDERVNALLPPAAEGMATVGRERPELLATAGRLLLREDLLLILELSQAVRHQLLNQAETHLGSLMPTRTADRLTPPSTVGHFLTGVGAELGRGLATAEMAFQSVNRSPLGAGALASNGYPIDRERVAALLGFAGPVANTWDALSATDFWWLVLAAVETVAGAVHRLLVEWRDWLTLQPASLISAGDDGSQPLQKDELEAHQGLIRDIWERTSRLAEQVREASDLTLGSFFPPLIERWSDLMEVLSGELVWLSDFLSGVTFNRAPLAFEAGRDHATSHELADLLIETEGLNPNQARAIAEIVIRRARADGIEASGITTERVDAAALMVIGRDLAVEVESISRALAPRPYLAKRQATGAPAPEATRAVLQAERERAEAVREWLHSTRSALDQVRRDLERLVAEAVAAGEPG